MTKRRRRNKLIYAVASFALAVFFIHFLIILGVVGGAQARADVAQTPEKYESQSVLDDLAGMTVDGKAFSLSDYPQNDNDSPRILAFIEYCYAYNADMRGYYGLYVYVYNPQQIIFDCISGKNKLEMQAGGMEQYKKYDLQLLDVTMQAGYENRFYKLKVAFTAAQRTEVLQKLNAESRVYNLSGIELLDPNGKDYPNAHDYPIGGTDENGKPRGMTYTYTGYAAGYGENGTSKTTLDCKCDGLETVSLKAKHTVYRPKGTAYTDGYKSKTVRNSLSSVYFAVPKNLRNYYDDLHAIHASWLEAETAPMLVTGNKDVYDNLLQFVGDSTRVHNDYYLNASLLNDNNLTTNSAVGVNKLVVNAGLKYLLTSNNYTEGWGEVPLNYSGNSYFQGFYETAITALATRRLYSNGKYYNYLPENGTMRQCYYIDNADERHCGRIIDQLNWLFYAPDGVDATDRYCVSSTELYTWAYKTFAEITNGSGIDYYKLAEQREAEKEELENPDISNPWGGGDLSNPVLSPEYPKIYFEQTELKRGNNLYLPLLDRLAENYRDEIITPDTKYSITSNEWVTESKGWWFLNWIETNLIEKPPQDNIKAVYEVTDADFQSNDKTSICERLLISELDYDEFRAYYEENKANNRIYLFRFDKSEYISTELAEYDLSNADGYSSIKKLDTNAYFCKEKIYLDFDIIDITVTKSGEEFVVGCVMTPIDIFPSTTPPPITTSDMPEWWIPALVIEVVLVTALVGTVLIKKHIKGRFEK